MLGILEIRNLGVGGLGNVEACECLNTRADGRLTTKPPLCSTSGGVKRAKEPWRDGQGQEKGRTITRITTITTAMPGTSFMILSALPESWRLPAASVLP